MEVYSNGQFIDASGAEEILEPGFLFGWGAFETLRVYKKKTAFLEAHLGRLKKGLDFLGLDYPDVDFGKTIATLLEKNHLDDAYLRITAYKKRKSTGLMVYAAEFDYYKEDSYKAGAKVALAPFARHSQDPFIKVKSTSYVKSRLAWFSAQKQGKDEALFLNEYGVIQEGSRSNVFFVKQEEVFTPSVECGLLEGVTRKVVIDLCKREGLAVNEGEFTKEDLLSAEEVFLTSSLMEVMPVSGIEYKTFDHDAYVVTPLVLKKYREEVSK